MKSRTINRGVRWLGVALVVGLFLPGAAWAVTCDPAGVPQDLADVTAAIAAVNGACDCDGYTSHGQYMKCARPVAKAQAYTTNSCKRTVVRYFRKSTCSHAVKASGNKIPCLKQTASGRVRCTIRPDSKCGDSEGLQDGCPGYVHCADAGDTNGDYKVGLGDVLAPGGACAGNVCGDGNVAGGEECDDGFGNADAPDACRLGEAPDTTPCTNPACGDGITDTGEGCDDAGANACAADACRTDCTAPACGDGITDTGEECDDGDSTSVCDSIPADNSMDPDACRPTCEDPSCGDGVTDPGLGEACDGLDNVACPGFPGFPPAPPFGNGCAGAGTANECQCSICGDTVVDLPVEQCDIGPDGTPNTTDDGVGLCGGPGGFCNSFCTCPKVAPFDMGPTVATTDSTLKILGALARPLTALPAKPYGDFDLRVGPDLAAPFQLLTPLVGSIAPIGIPGALFCAFLRPLDPNNPTQALFASIVGDPNAAGFGYMDALGTGTFAAGALAAQGLPADPEYALYADHCTGLEACDSKFTLTGPPCHPLLSDTGGCVAGSPIVGSPQCSGGPLGASAGDCQASSGIVPGGLGLPAYQCGPGSKLDGTCGGVNPHLPVVLGGPNTCSGAKDPAILGTCVASSGIAASHQCAAGGPLGAGSGDCAAGSGVSGYPYQCAGTSPLSGTCGGVNPNLPPASGGPNTCSAAQDAAFLGTCNGNNPYAGLPICDTGPLSVPAGTCVADPPSPTTFSCALGTPLGGVPPGGVAFGAAPCTGPGSGPAECGLPCAAPLDHASCGAPCPAGNVDCGIPCATDNDCGLPCEDPSNPGTSLGDAACGAPCPSGDVDCGIPCAVAPGTPVDLWCAAPCTTIASSPSQECSFFSKQDVLTDPNKSVCVSEGPTDPGCTLGIGIPADPNSTLDPNACLADTIGPVPGSGGWRQGDAFLFLKLALTGRAQGDPCTDPTGHAAPDLYVFTTNHAVGTTMDAWALDSSDPIFNPGGVLEMDTWPHVQAGVRDGVPFPLPDSLNSSFDGTSLAAALPVVDTDALAAGVFADITLLVEFTDLDD